MWIVIGGSAPTPALISEIHGLGVFMTQRLLTEQNNLSHSVDQFLGTPLTAISSFITLSLPFLKRLSLLEKSLKI